jgi:hypothetical protein
MQFQLFVAHTIPQNRKPKKVNSKSSPIVGHEYLKLDLYTIAHIACKDYMQYLEPLPDYILNGKKSKLGDFPFMVSKGL